MNRKERKRQGICVDCDSSAIGDRIRCKVHQAKNAGRAAKYYEKKRLQGTCLNCHRAVSEGRVRCGLCNFKNNYGQQKFQAKKKIEDGSAVPAESNWQIIVQKKEVE